MLDDKDVTSVRALLSCSNEERGREGRKGGWERDAINARRLSYMVVTVDVEKSLGEKRERENECL